MKAPKNLDIVQQKTAEPPGDRQRQEHKKRRTEPMLRWRPARSSWMDSPWAWALLEAQKARDCGDGGRLGDGGGMSSVGLVFEDFPADLFTFWFWF